MSSLLEKAQSKEFTPGVRDGRAIVKLLGEADKDGAAHLVRALVRMGTPGLGLCLEASRTAQGVERARLLEVVGKLATASDVDARDALMSALEDETPRVVKVAARALGRLGATGAIDLAAKGDVERALLAAKERAVRPDLRETVIEALGKVGGRASLEAIATDDASRTTTRAKVMLAREIERNVESSIDATVKASAPIDIRFHCREGLEPIVIEELGGRFRAKRADRGFVDARLEDALQTIFVSRASTHVTFPVVDRAFGADEVLAEAVAREVTSSRSRLILSTFTRGRVRYRIAWKSGAHRRSAVFDVASRVASIEPAFVNDPTRSTWEFTVDDSRGRLRIDLSPKSLEDSRFAYRVADVPAASHPTIAAAIVHVGGVRAHDVVWDPFVGSALELVERARSGGYEKLFGTDTKQDALVAAKKNLESAKVSDFSLEKNDALRVRIPKVTLIITNPPMGRRVTSGESLDKLLVPFMAHAARTLTTDGRMAWITPSPRDTDRAAERAGLEVAQALTVDMGGFPATLQLLVKSHGSRTK